MKYILNLPTEIEITKVQVKAGVRYWEDATVDGVDDTDGSLIPCKNGDIWMPLIEIDTGKILNWEMGKVATIHYKVCDSFLCELLDNFGEAIKTYEGYVPDFMCPKDSGYGDYIIMDIDENGFIKDWKFSTYVFDVNE